MKIWPEKLKVCHQFFTSQWGLLRKTPSQNTVGKKEYAGDKYFILFPIMFPPDERPSECVVRGRKIWCPWSRDVVSVVARCGVRGREVERRPRNLEVPSSIPGSGCQIWDIFIGTYIRSEHWCSFQEAESREISISCKNLFLNRCKINMFV